MSRRPGYLSQARSKEVAQELYVAPGTVKARVANIYRKLDARNRAVALEQARSMKLLG